MICMIGQAHQQVGEVGIALRRHLAATQRIPRAASKPAETSTQFKVKLEAEREETH